MSVKTITTAEPSIAPLPMVKHIIKRKRQPDGSWGEFEERTLCGILWDKPFLSGLPSCKECTEILLKELRA